MMVCTITRAHIVGGSSFKCSTVDIGFNGTQNQVHVKLHIIILCIQQMNIHNHRISAETIIIY